MLTDVHFYGALGKKYGRHYRLDVNSVAELVRAMEALKPGFYQTLLTMKNVDFGVKVGGGQIGKDRLAFPSGGKSISLTPVVRGSGGDAGWIEIVAGVALVAVGFFASAFLGPVGPIIIGLGLSLALGGVATLLSPSPTVTDTNVDNKHKPSYQFNGPINTIEEGQPVPVLLGGPLWIGSAVVSAGISSADTPTSGDGGTMTTSDAGPGVAAVPLAYSYL
jgi:predicted phage tail protein